MVVTRMLAREQGDVGIGQRRDLPGEAERRDQQSALHLALAVDVGNVAENEVVGSDLHLVSVVLQPCQIGATTYQ
jgi:hypothetical protein